MARDGFEQATVERLIALLYGADARLDGRRYRELADVLGAAVAGGVDDAALGAAIARRSGSEGGRDALLRWLAARVRGARTGPEARAA